MQGYRFQVVGYSLIFFLLSTVHCPLSTVFAAESTTSGQIVDIGHSRLHPASPFYFLKAVREQFELHFAQTYHLKQLRNLEFATRRIRETKALININPELIPPTLERYIGHLNNIPQTHQPNDKWVPILQDNLRTHTQSLEQIYYQTDNLRAKMFIRSAMNRTFQRADMPNEAKNSICNLFAKESSSSALNKVEQQVLLQRIQKCQNIN